VKRNARWCVRDKSKKGGVALFLAPCAVALTVAGCGGGTPSSSAPTNQPDTAASKGPANPCDHPHTYSLAARFETIEPAQINRQAISGFPGNVIGQVRDAWNAGDHHSTTTVLAGVGGYRHGNDGELLILRDGLAPRTNAVFVRDAGPIRITNAPLGCQVVTWAQQRGNLQFTSRRGVSGTLDLSDDTITLSP
jgi:hypothetical protein